ncbi:MAG: cysteine synthase family protein [Chryseolinea sp.]
MNAIGNTQLLKLDRITEPGSADIFVKYEASNPTLSMKDRMALSMIEGAERKGLIKPGGTVIEFTGGSTGSSLAMVCAIKGYKAHLVSSDAFSEEKLQTMRVFGANVEVIPSDGGKINIGLFQRMNARIQELRQQPNTFWTDQFNNVDNKTAYHQMALEMLSQADNTIDEFITGIGTGGSFSGTAEVLKEKLPNIRCIAVEPDKVRAISGGDTTGAHKLEGIGTGILPPTLRRDLIDEVIAVTDEDAYDTARKLARIEGIWGGTTSGANVWAALQRARTLGPGRKVVTIVVDSGMKYLRGDLYNY